MTDDREIECFERGSRRIRSCAIRDRGKGSKRVGVEFSLFQFDRIGFRVVLELVVVIAIWLLAVRQHGALHAAIVTPVAGLLRHIRRIRGCRPNSACARRSGGRRDVRIEARRKKSRVTEPQMSSARRLFHERG